MGWDSVIDCFSCIVGAGQPISEDTAARLCALFDDAYKPIVMHAFIPDTRWLPRRTKKTWRKFMDGRMLGSREWKCIRTLTSHRPKRVKYSKVEFRIGAL